MISKMALIIVVVALIIINNTGVLDFGFVSATAHVHSPGFMCICTIRYCLLVGSEQSLLHVQVDGSPESTFDMQRCFVRILVVILGTTFPWPACLRGDMLMWHRAGQTVRLKLSDSRARATHVLLLCVIWAQIKMLGKCRYYDKAMLAFSVLAEHNTVSTKDRGNSFEVSLRYG